MRNWELKLAIPSTVLAVAIGVFTPSVEAFVFLAMFASILLGIWLGKMVYAPDEVAHPEAFKSLSWEEIAERKRKGGRRAD